MLGRARPDADPDPGAAVPDRRSLQQAIEAMAASYDPRPVFAAAFGVERFARLRGLVGADRAEELVLGLGQRLKGSTPGWRSARLATDALGVVFRADSADAAVAACQAVRQTLEGAAPVGQHAIDIRLSCGLAVSGPPGSRLQAAELALDAARAARTDFHVFDAAAHAAAAEGLSLMPELRRALAGGRVSLAHQPKYDLRRRRISGVECLARWTHPVHGPISPASFVAMAEETGDIAALTDYVLGRAIAEQAALAAAGHVLPFAVNLSGKLLGDAGFIDGLLEQAAGASGPLRVEITETAVIERPETALANLARLTAAGIGVSIDDYGSGLSSLAYLKRITADELKLDRSIVADAARSGRDALVVRSAIDLAHGLGMTVVAEGVEDDATAALLAGMGCDQIQGFVFAHPMRYAELVAFLAHRMDIARAAG